VDISPARQIGTGRFAEYTGGGSWANRSRLNHGSTIRVNRSARLRIPGLAHATPLGGGMRERMALVAIQSLYTASSGLPPLTRYAIRSRRSSALKLLTRPAGIAEVGEGSIERIRSRGILVGEADEPK